MNEHTHEGASKHASIQTYLVIAAILTVVTFLEVATYFMPFFREPTSVGSPLLVPVLSVMAIFKFWLVVGYYMHLSYDKPFYRRVFVSPLLLAIAMVVVVMVFTAMRTVRTFW